MFHFNKGHLADPTIPMWTLKAKGKTYYVNHVECDIPWSTKETPDNPSTKGSIKVKNCLLTIDADNNANLSELKDVDRDRLHNLEKGITRVRIRYDWIDSFKQALATHNIKHSPFKTITGACTTSFYVTDIYSKADFTMLTLKLSHTDLRELMPNESYYRWYSDPKFAGSNIDEDQAWADEEDADDE